MIINVAFMVLGRNMVVAGVCAGSTIQGRASGLSSVQYTNGECMITPQVGVGPCIKIAQYLR